VLEPYAVKPACTVLRGVKKKSTLQNLVIFLVR